MIKDFFGKIITRLDHSDTKVANIQTELKENQIELKNFRQEQRQINKRLEKKIDMNSDSLALLTKDLRKAEKMEFAIYNHERRITKLEKVKKLA